MADHCRNGHWVPLARMRLFSSSSKTCFVVCELVIPCFTVNSLCLICLLFPWCLFNFAHVFRSLRSRLQSLVALDAIKIWCPFLHKRKAYVGLRSQIRWGKESRKILISSSLKCLKLQVTSDSKNVLKTYLFWSLCTILGAID